MRKIAISLFSASLLAGSVVEINPISVTATGIKEEVLKQPLSIATKAEDEIKLDQVVFQKDLLNSLSGVRIEQTGSVIGHMTAIRMPLNTGPYYLFMQDGIPVQSGGFFNHNGLAYTTFQSATSVEVLKGAGTALYGSDAVAAVVNVKSVKAPSKTKEIIIKGMGGSDGYGSASFEMSDSIDKESGYRANAAYMHSDGWRQHTKTDRAEANIRYDKTLNSDNDMKVVFNFSKTEADQADTFNDYENITSGSTAASDDNNYFDALELTDVKRKFDYARLSLEWSNYSYEDLEISTTPYIRYNRNRYVATWEPNLPSNDNEMVTFGLLQKNTLDTSWGRFIAGFDAEYTKSSLKYNQDFDNNVTSWSGSTFYPAGAIYDYDVDYMAIAPYMHADYNVNKEIILTAGLRYDYNRFDYNNNLSEGVDASGKYYRPADRTDSFNHVSPKLSLSYRPTKNMNAYIRYANGFRIPQATRLYSMKAGYENITLDPEKTNTYEVGFKSKMNEKVLAELALYYMTIDDTITEYRPTVGDRYYDNGGTTIHKGVEVTLDAKMSQDFATHVAYSYSKHNYDNDVKYGDNEMAKAPNHLANARLIYTPSQIKGLKLMGEWQYVGSYWMDDDHTVDRYKGYSIGNLKADYMLNKHITFYGKITNITDERYSVNSYYAYGKENYTPGDPRQFYAGLSYKW